MNNDFALQFYDANSYCAHKCVKFTCLLFQIYKFTQVAMFLLKILTKPDFTRILTKRNPYNLYKKLIKYPRVSHSMKKMKFKANKKTNFKNSLFFIFLNNSP